MLKCVAILIGKMKENYCFKFQPRDLGVPFIALTSPFGLPCFLRTSLSCAGEDSSTADQMDPKWLASNVGCIN